MFVYRSVVVALLLFVGGCAAGIGAPSVEASKTIGRARTVGVISAVGHTFALQKIGITVFGNELNEVPIGSWGIDNAVARKVSSLLGRRFTVKRISHSFRNLDAKVEDVVRKVATTQNHDLIIVVTRSSTPFGSTNQIMTGLGMLQYGSVLFPDNVMLFAVTAVQLYDGRTFQRLASLRTGSTALFSEIGGINFPHRKLDGTWWPATPRAVHNAKLKAATRALLEEGLARTVPAIMAIKGAKKTAKTWSPFMP